MNTYAAKYALDVYERPVLEAPQGADKRADKRIVLHSCCAPCAGEVMEALHASGFEQLVYFYNPNIHPQAEYQIRKDENKRFCDKHGIGFVDADYDDDAWFRRTRGMEWEPERGARCSACFDMRFERTAEYAARHGYRLFSSTLGISRWKDMAQINGCGQRAARGYDDLTYWTFNWRKEGGASRMVELAKRERFYQQEYCGCVYSLRDTNAWRARQGRAPIVRNIKFYEPAHTSAPINAATKAAKTAVT